jgi:hypothetical protein
MRFKFKSALGVLVLALALSGLTAVSALAAGSPVVETKPATAIAKTTVTLNGNVNPNGAETKYHFQYGTTGLFGKNTAEYTLGAGTSNVPVSVNVTGLTENEQYYFRLVATNVDGTTDGARETFKTTGQRPVLEEVFSEKLANKYTLTLGKSAFVDTEGSAVECESGVAEGKLTGPQTSVFTLSSEIFKGCELQSYGKPCETSGAAHGEIRGESSAQAELVYLSKAKKEAGLLLTPHIPLASCGTLGLRLTGTLLAPITPVNTATTTYAVPFAESAGTPANSKYEGGEAAFEMSLGVEYPGALSAKEAKLTFKEGATPKIDA